MKVINIKPQEKNVKYVNKTLYITNTIDNDKLNEHSQFMIGSITKVFTAILILILSQNKLLNVNDKVSKYIKGIKNKKINILDILNHKSGLKRMPTNIIILQYKNATDVTNSFINEDLFDSPYGEYKYSNIGYIILGAIIEQICEENYIDVLHKYILQPLKLKDTYIGQTNIKLYISKIEKKVKLSKEEFNERYLAQFAGCLYSSVYDLIKFGKNIFTLLNKNSITILKTLYFYKEENKHLIIEHGGSINGGYADLKVIYLPKYKYNDANITLETAK